MSGFYIGNVKIDGDLALGPMAGVTDMPFRTICKEFGADLLYTEMISAKGIYYKNKITGNNINIKNNEDIIAYVKDIKNYKANLDVTIYSNKNETKYKIYQEVKNDKSIQIVKEPKEIENLTIEKENNQVRIKNTNLKLEKIYTDYSEYLSNLLCLDSIVKQIKNENIKVKEEGNTVVLQLENYEKNTYGKYIEIYFNKETKKIEKIEIKDKNQKTRICILYTDIEIN